MTSPSLDNSFDLLCPECGYDLRAIGSDRCPECGTPFDRATAANSGIPWANRKVIGSVRGYQRTVRMATRHPRTLANEVARPISYRDAQYFRWITVVIVSFVPAIVWMVAFFGYNIARGSTWQMPAPWQGGTFAVPAPDFVLPWISGITMVATPLLSIVVFFALVTGVSGYWFHPRSLSIVRQNRAVAMSAYTCAPLFWMAILFAIPPLALIIDDKFGITQQKPGLLVGLAIVMAELFIAVSVFMLWFNTLIVLRRAVDATSARLVSAAIGLPIAWALSAAIAFGAIPWVIGYVWLMIDSMR